MLKPTSIPKQYQGKADKLADNAMFIWQPRHIATSVAGVAIRAQNLQPPAVGDILPAFVHLRTANNNQLLRTELLAEAPKYSFPSVTDHLGHLDRLREAVKTIRDHADPEVGELLDGITTERQRLAAYIRLESMDILTRDTMMGRNGPGHLENIA